MLGDLDNLMCTYVKNLKMRYISDLIHMSEDTSTLESKNGKKNSAIKRSFFSNLEIIVTSSCNIKCRHCIYDCQPTSREKLSNSVIKDLIRQAATISSFRSVVFTGGEAFLEYDILVESIALCEELGLESSVVTNGFWAQNSQITKQKLKQLKGLRTLNVSTDSFHQEFVPVYRIRYIIESCHDLGIKCVVRFSYLNDPASELGIIKKQLSGLEGLYTISAMPVTPFGRAAMLIDELFFYEYDPNGIPCCGADDPIIDSNGDVKVCPGGLFSYPDNSLLKVGNIYNETLETIKKSTNINLLAQTLRLHGPEGLVRLVRNQAQKEGISFIPPQTGEVKDLCSLCKYVITDLENSKLLQCAVKDPEVYREIAFARLKEFGETSMLYGNRYTLKAERNADIIADAM
jgi:MoaA/NifB/PqqE/SkfB family radical SAM enzyme